MRKIIFPFAVCLLAISSFGQSDSLKKAIALEAKPVYIKATALIMELKKDIELAKKGTIKKLNVIIHYNETVGSVMGKQTTFVGVEKKIKESGDAYPQFLFLKEEARIAYLKAAEAKYNSEH